MLTLSPPNSFASAPHSGSHARILSAAGAGCARSHSRAQTVRNIDFMSVSFRLELVRAVCAQAVDVLDEHLVVGEAHTRLVGGVLQPYATELARTPVQHEGVARRIVRREQREIGRGRTQAVRDDPVLDRAITQPVVAVANAPLRVELPYRLPVPARLARAQRVAHPPEQRAARAVVVGERAVLLQAEVLAL